MVAVRRSFVFLVSYNLDVILTHRAPRVGALRLGPLPAALRSCEAARNSLGSKGAAHGYVPR